MKGRICQISKQRQSEPQENPVSTELVKEDRIYANRLVAKYQQERNILLKILQEKLARKTKGLREENTRFDNMITDNCVHCHGKRILRIDNPICSIHPINDLVEVKA